MPCSGHCVPPPPPPLFDIPPPPDPSLVLHLLLQDQSLDGDAFKQFSFAQCPESTSTLSFWSRLERAAGGDLLLPGFALLFLFLCAVTSAAAFVLRQNRKRRMSSTATGTSSTGTGEQRQKRKKSRSNSAILTTAGGMLPLACSSSSSSGSPEHCGAQFSRRSSTETMASATSPQGQQQHQGWHFQPNFFAYASASIRPNTVGAARRKLPSSSTGIGFPACCSPATQPMALSPPRTVALRLPRHFSSSEGQFIAWRTENTPPMPCSSCLSAYGGSELYEELVGTGSEDIAEAPYKKRPQPPPRRMPPPASRPPPPPAEHCCSSGASPGSSSADDLEQGSGRQPCQRVNRPRAESGYGTGGKRPLNSFWRGQERRDFSPSLQQPTFVNDCRPPSFSIYSCTPKANEEEDYIVQQKPMQKDMTYV